MLLTTMQYAVGCKCRPIPIPTLDEFVLLHKALQAAVQAQPEMLGLLQGARRSFGWNVIGISGSPSLPCQTFL